MDVVALQPEDADVHIYLNINSNYTTRIQHLNSDYFLDLKLDTTNAFNICRKN